MESIKFPGQYGINENHTEQKNLSIEMPDVSEWQDLKKIMLEAFKVNGEAYNRDFEIESKKEDGYWQKELESRCTPEKFIFFLKNGEDLKGMASGKMEKLDNKKIWHVMQVYLNKDLRGQRIGEDLVNKVLSEIKARGGEIARLSVSKGEKQEDARKLYKRLGFKNVDVVRKLMHWKSPKALNWDFMEKDLK